MNLFQNMSKWFNIKIFGENSNNQNIKEYKLLVLGEKGVGKTSLCNRFLKNEFNLEVKQTAQSDCSRKELYLLDLIIHLYIIDTSENILSNDRSHLYGNVNGALILYDISKSKSFEGVDKWIIDLKQNTNNNLPIIIVGNKSDLSFLRNVDYEEGSQKAISYNCDFIETSCIEENFVHETFKTIVAKIYYNEMPNEQKNMFKVNLYKTMNQEEMTAYQLKRLDSFTDFTLDTDEKDKVLSNCEKIYKKNKNEGIPEIINEKDENET